MPGLDQMLASYGRIPVLPHGQQLHLSRQLRAWLDWDGGPDAAPQTVRRRGLRAKQRLELLSAAHGLSVSSYVRVVINRHTLAVDRQEQAVRLQPLDEFYRTL